MMVRFIAFALAVVLLTSSMAFSQSEQQSYNTFRVKMLVRTDTKWQQQDAVLKFESDRMVLRSVKDDVNLQVIPYSELKTAEYTYTRGRRKSSVALGLAGNVFALPLLMKKIEKHWLTVESEGSRAILDLDKNNYKFIMAAFETNTGRKVVSGVAEN
jgi:hypothetical protein